MSKYTPQTVKKLEAVFEELGYTIRYEKGNFQSGYCLVKNQKIVIVNKFFDAEAKANCLLDLLSSLDFQRTELSKKTLKTLTELLPTLGEQQTLELIP